MPEDLQDPNLDSKQDEEILDNALEEKEEKPPVEEEKEEVEEQEEKEEKEEVEEEEEEDLTSPRPSFKAITAKFPELFKEFPALRHAFFREQEYAKAFPTVEEAQEAAEKAQNFDTLETSIMSGDPTELIKSIADVDRSTLSKFVENFLPTLYKDASLKELYYQAATPVVENVLRAAAAEGNKRENKNLLYAAQYINEFLFGTTEINPPKEVKPDPEKEKFEKERAEFYEGKFQEFHKEVDTAVGESLKKIISSGLEDTLSPFLRDKITEEVMKQIDAQIVSDPQHMRIMNNLWMRARKAGLPKEFQGRIKSAYLERVKPLIPVIRDKVRKEALRTSSEKKNVSQFKPHKDLAGSPARQGNARSVKASEIDWSKASDEDVINAALSGGTIPLKKR